MKDVERYLQAGTRENTRRSYQSAIEHFEVSWGGFLPATSDSIVRYLVDYADTLSSNTLKQRLAALAQWQQINHVAGLPPTPLKVRVDISPEIFEKVALDDSVFVFVQTLSGSKVPLATIRLKVSSLPAEVEFSGADAIVTSNTLSQTAAIQVTARVSRGGKSRSGEWLGRSSTTLNSKSARLKLTINLPDI